MVVSKQQKDSSKTRQHIVPQWLQRGFSDQYDGASAPVVVYRKDGKVFRTGTLNVSVRRGFYTHEEHDADPRITELDGSLSEIADRLRTLSGALNQGNALEACRLVAHLEVRQHAVERVVRTMQRHTSQKVCEMFDSSEHTIEWLGRPPIDLRLSGYAIERRCLGRFDRRRKGPGRQPIDWRLMIRHVVASLNSLKKRMLAEIEAGLPVESVVAGWSKGLRDEDIVEDSVQFNRSKILSLDPEAESRIRGYSERRWSVIQLQEDIVLGDSMVFHDVDDTQRGQNYLHNPWRGSMAYLPLSCRSVLVGRGRGFRRPRLTPLRMRIFAARSSAELFVARSEKDEYTSLLSIIGEHRVFATGAHWEFVAEECLEV